MQAINNGHTVERFVAAEANGAKYTLPARLPEEEGDPNGAARAGGLSLHAGIDIEPAQREKLERLCRYVSRPPVAADRLALTPSGHVRYTLKSPYRDGTTHVVLEPLDFIARQSALIRNWKPWERSTGPKTPDGKATVSRNAWKGGERQALRLLATLLRKRC